MVDETATITAPETPAAAPAGYGAPAEEPAAQPTGTDEGATPAEVERPEAPEETFETWLAQTDAEDFKWKDDYRKHVEEVHAKGWQAARQQFDPQVKAIHQAQERGHQLYTKANEGFSLFMGRLDQLEAQGALDSCTVEKLWNSDAALSQSLRGIGDLFVKAAVDKAAPVQFFAGGIEAANFFFEKAAEITGQASLHSKFAARNDAVKEGREEPAKVAEDFLRAVMEAGIRQGKKVAAEAKIAETRKDAGPSEAHGASGSA